MPPDGADMHLSDSTVLLLIDVQEGFQDVVLGPRNNPDAEQKIGTLLEAWRRSRRPVVHVQHLSRSQSSPFHPKNPGVELQPLARPLRDEPLFTKSVNSAFIGTTLESFLQERGYDTLIVVGLTTDHCVSTTVRAAGNLGFIVYVVDDATATYERVDHTGRAYPADDIHRAALASLHGEFATVVTTSQILGQVATVTPA